MHRQNAGMHCVATIQKVISEFFSEVLMWNNFDINVMAVMKFIEVVVFLAKAFQVNTAFFLFYVKPKI